jgi:hypothetical protein
MAGSIAEELLKFPEMDVRQCPEVFTCEPHGPGLAVVASLPSPGDSHDATYDARTRRRPAAGRTALGGLPLEAQPESLPAFGRLCGALAAFRSLRRSFSCASVALGTESSVV